jgi:uncharacterized integral membrane protein
VGYNIFYIVNNLRNISKQPVLRCEYCGHSILLGGAQCNVCTKTLCNKHNHWGFCEPHFAGLLPEDQAVVRAIKRKSQIFTYEMLIGCILLVILTPLVFIAILDEGTTIFHIFLSIGIPLILWVGYAIGGSIYYFRTKPRDSLNIQNIALKYRAGTEIPSNNTIPSH